MGKPNCDNRQFLDRISSPPLDSSMNWHTPLSQSDPSIQLHQNQPASRPAAAAAHSTSYKVSIGHETVNITELARHREPSPEPPPIVPLIERRRVVTRQRGANILSLCFMCFVSAALILIAISSMHLLLKTNDVNYSSRVPLIVQSANITPGLLYIFVPPSASTDNGSQMILPVDDHTIRDLATTMCLFIVVLNCLSLLVFSIEIYLGCNTVISKRDSHRNVSMLVSSASSRFIAICGFYASIPALILVMCLFILLNMSLIPAVISLVILGLGLVFILLTLLAYFSTMKKSNFVAVNGKLDDTNASFYHTTALSHFNEDDIDLATADELSTLV